MGEVKTEEDIDIEFIEAFKELCRKYGRTFVQGQIKVIREPNLKNA